MTHIAIIDDESWRDARALVAAWIGKSNDDLIAAIAAALRAKHTGEGFGATVLDYCKGEKRKVNQERERLAARETMLFDVVNAVEAEQRRLSKRA